jgi:very-short-patch-repair endonuclease
MSLYIPYSNNIHYKQTRKKLRRNATKAEKKLWQFLRDKQLEVKFRRQYTIATYIVDFYSHELKLIIEIDGGIHSDENVQKKDKERQTWLEQHGYTVVRFTNEQVLEGTEHAYNEIVRIINTMKKVPPL